MQNDGKICFTLLKSPLPLSNEPIEKSCKKIATISRFFFENARNKFDLLRFQKTITIFVKPINLYQSSLYFPHDKTIDSIIILRENMWKINLNFLN